MDILLEFADTFIADYVYAHLFPITHSNETEFNASTPLMEPWVWRPASKLLNVQPSQAAYMSSLTRDNPYRQFFTLMLSAWYTLYFTLKILKFPNNVCHSIKERLIFLSTFFLGFLELSIISLLRLYRITCYLISDTRNIRNF